MSAPTGHRHVDPPPRLRLAYGTNGLGDHRLADALALLAELGYDGVALTLDHHHLDPFADDVREQVARVAGLLERHRLGVVVETGARFLLDPRRKHEPTLLADDPAPRLELLRRALRIGADLDAQAVHLWSGVRPRRVAPETAWSRLVDGCARTLEEAERHGMPLAFEPEPGMLVERMDDWDRLATALGHHPLLRMTLDIGHCQCLEDEPPAACVWRAADSLAHVQVEDMRRGVHEHLDFGEGEIDFPPVMAALGDIGYRGLVSVELTRHSHTAHTVVPRAIEFLKDAEREAVSAA